MLRCLHCVDGNLQIAVSTVLETDGKGKATGQFAVSLRFCGAGANGAPADHVGYIFRGNRIEHFIGNRHPQLGDMAQQATGDAESLGDQMGAVHVRVIDQSLPANSGTRFLKVDPHDQQQLVADPVGKVCQAFGVFHGCFGVVDGAGADHHHQAAVAPMEDILDPFAAPADEFPVGL